MNPELEQLLAADEEGRARVAFTEARCGREEEEVRRECDALLSSRRHSVEDELARELGAIREAGDRELGEAQRTHAQYRDALRERGERELERAAAIWAGIVGGGAPR